MVTSIKIYMTVTTTVNLPFRVEYISVYLNLLSVSVNDSELTIIVSYNDFDLSGRDTCMNGPDSL